GGSNPNEDEAGDLQDLWDDTFRHAKTLLLAQGPFAAYFGDFTLDQEREALAPQTSVQLRDAIGDILDGMPGSAGPAADYWADFVPLLEDVKEYILRPYGIVGMADHHLLADLTEAAMSRSLPLTLEQL